jgi:hypothetical protein
MTCSKPWNSPRRMELEMMGIILSIYIYTSNNSNNNDNNDNDNKKKNGHVPSPRPSTALWKFDTAMEHQKYLGKSDVQTSMESTACFK